MNYNCYITESNWLCISLCKCSLWHVCNHLKYNYNCHIAGSNWLCIRLCMRWLIFCWKSVTNPWHNYFISNTTNKIHFIIIYLFGVWLNHLFVMDSEWRARLRCDYIIESDKNVTKITEKFIYLPLLRTRGKVGV